MPSTFASVAAELAAATSVRSAGAVASAHLSAIDAGVRCTALPVDPRRGVIASSDDGEGDSTGAVALDHLPPSAESALREGGAPVELASQTAEYGALLGLPNIEGRLLIKGVVLDGEPAAVIAVALGKRGASSRVRDALAGLLPMLELTCLRILERDARFEAVDALHDVTTRLRSEHASALSRLERELQTLRTGSRAGTTEIVRDLRTAVSEAERRAADAEEHAALLERSVADAVARMNESQAMLTRSEQTVSELRRKLAARDATPTTVE